MPELSSNETVSRLRIYISESDRWRGKPLYAAVLEELRKKGIAGATVFRGAAGFGAGSHVQNSSIEVLSMDLPIVVETIDSPENISSVLETLYPMVNEGMITRDEIQLIKYTHRFLNPLPADLPVSQVMTRDVVHFSPQTRLAQAWKEMLTRQVKVVPVVDGAGKVAGILTDGDLLERAGIQQRLSIALRLNPEKLALELDGLEKSALTVGTIMTTPVVTVNESDPLALVVTRLIRNDLKRLPVVDAAGKLTGIISRLDILRQVVKTTQVTPVSTVPVGAARTVADVMTRDFPLVDQDAGLEKIIEKFTQYESIRLVVVDEKGKAIGLISDSDVVARIQPEKQGGILNALRRLGKTPKGNETAYDLMSPGVLTALSDTPVVEAARLMLKDARKWLVVVNSQNLPQGLVDRKILLESLSSVYLKN
jgi:CBS-domain-containing membrane protein